MFQNVSVLNFNIFSLNIALTEKYDFVGRLLKVRRSLDFKYRNCHFRLNFLLIYFQPGEQPTNYSDEEDEPGSSEDKSGGEEKIEGKSKSEE